MPWFELTTSWTWSEYFTTGLLSRLIHNTYILRITYKTQSTVFKWKLVNAYRNCVTNKHRDGHPAERSSSNCLSTELSLIDSKWESLGCVWTAHNAHYLTQQYIYILLFPTGQWRSLCHMSRTSWHITSCLHHFLCCFHAFFDVFNKHNWFFFFFH